MRIQLIKVKNEEFHIFKECKSFVQNKSSNTIKVLKTDGGRESVSRDIKMLYTEYEIVHEVFVCNIPIFSKLHYLF